MHRIHYSILYRGVSYRAEPRHMFTNDIKSTVKVGINSTAMPSYTETSMSTPAGKCVLFICIFAN